MQSMTLYTKLKYLVYYNPRSAVLDKIVDPIIGQHFPEVWFESHNTDNVWEVSRAVRFGVEEAFECLNG